MSFLIFILVIILISIVLITIVAILINLYQKKQIQHKEKINNLKIVHENDILKAQIQVQENTFQLISREIHDNIGQKLSLAKLQLNNLTESQGFQYRNSLEDIVAMLTESLNDLRDLSRSMSSEFIAGNGLIKSIENEIAQLNKSADCNFRMTVTGDPIFLNPEKDVFLFRIVQEALTNVLKHASASHIHIKLHYTNDHLELEVMDDGIGFTSSDHFDSNGIKNITSRARLMDGTSEIISVPGVGTTVKVKIPIYDKQ